MTDFKQFGDPEQDDALLIDMERVLNVRLIQSVNGTRAIIEFDDHVKREIWECDNPIALSYVKQYISNQPSAIQPPAKEDKRT